MTKQQIAINTWLRAATPEDAKLLAKVAKTSVPYLRHIANGRRGISCELAYRLALASMQFRGRAMRLAQPELCAACGKHGS